VTSFVLAQLYGSFKVETLAVVTISTALLSFYTMSAMVLLQ